MKFFILAAVLLQLAETPVITVSRHEVRESDIRAFGFYGHSVCGQDGTIFLRPHVTSSIETDPIWSFSAAGKKKAEFAFERDIADPESIDSFTVAGDGSLFVVVRTSKGLTKGVAFTGEGKQRTKTTIQVPDKFASTSVGVFRNGSIFIDGNLFDKNLSKEQGKQLNARYSAVFSSDGSLLKRIALPGESTTVDPAYLSYRHTLAHADGNLYLLGRKIIALSPMGEVTKQIAYEDPGEGYTARHIFATTEGIGVEFVRPGADGLDELLMHVYDVEAQELRRRYVFTRDAGNSFLCPADGGFLFYGVKQGRVAFTLAK